MNKTKQQCGQPVYACDLCSRNVICEKDGKMCHVGGVRARKENALKILHSIETQCEYKVLKQLLHENYTRFRLPILF